ncbi:hypothetical protein RZE82_09065 [Mollicutes bacterium LVI A0039]|nr:hypothetical protein RZE82_09065 [Mollicutes bacterium LVI A0039]
MLVILFYKLLSINIALNIASINTVGSISTISMYVNTAVAFVLVPFKYNDPLFIVGFGLATVILLVLTIKSTKNMYKNIVNRRQV